MATESVKLVASRGEISVAGLFHRVVIFPEIQICADKYNFRFFFTNEEKIIWFVLRIFHCK